MLRIFHVPSHLAYVAKLTAAEFGPVLSPTGRPLRLGELVELESWEFFDALHMHTVSTIAEVVAPGELAFWCQRSAVLALPYRRITHSGQLELARDLGLRAIAPDVPTLRAQLADGPTCAAVWFPPQALAHRQLLNAHRELYYGSRPQKM